MKIAIPASGDNLDSPLDPVFGRCKCFVIVEVEDKQIKSSHAVENEAAMQAGGAGIMAAQTVANEGANAVISSAVGPRALEVLNQAGIEMYQSVPGTVKENIQQFLSGKLTRLTAPGPVGGGMGKGMGGPSGRGRGQGRGQSFGSQ